MRIVDEKRQIVAEGPLWDAQRGLLYTVDILGRTIRTTNLDTGTHTEAEYPQQIGCIALTEDGAVLAAMEDGIYEALPDGSILPFCVPERIKGRRFNDGKVGPDGRLYLGTTDDRHEGAFYRLDADGTLTEILSGIGCSNGLAWSGDEKTMYYIDSPDRLIEAFDFDAQSGALSNRRTVMPSPDILGQPDGMTIDSQGRLWLAVWGGYCFYCIDPDSKSVIKRYEMPVAKVSCCAFAGRELKTLIITTASKDEDAMLMPDAGKTFAMECEVPGGKTWRFKRRQP